MCLVHIETRMLVFCQSAHSDACTPLHAAGTVSSIHTWCCKLLESMTEEESGHLWNCVQSWYFLESFWSYLHMEVKAGMKLGLQFDSAWTVRFKREWWTIMWNNWQVLHTEEEWQNWSGLLVSLPFKYAMGEGSNWEKFKEQTAYLRLCEGLDHKMSFCNPPKLYGYFAHSTCNWSEACMTLYQKSGIWFFKEP